MHEQELMVDDLKQTLSAYHLNHVCQVSEIDCYSSGTARWVTYGAVACIAVVLYWFTDTTLTFWSMYDVRFIDLLLLEIPEDMLATRSWISIVIGAVAVCGYHSSRVVRLQAALLQSSKWLSAALKSVGYGLIAADAGGHVIFMNSEAQKLTRRDLRKSAGMPISDVCQLVSKQGSAANELTSLIDTATRTDAAVALDCGSRLRAADGSEVCVAGKISSILDDQEVILGTIVVLQDISREGWRN